MLDLDKGAQILVRDAVLAMTIHANKQGDNEMIITLQFFFVVEVNRFVF